MYVYHYQDSLDVLRFRYDNAVHRPTLPQANHKHTPDGIQLCDAPALEQILREILSTK